MRFWMRLRTRPDGTHYIQVPAQVARDALKDMGWEAWPDKEVKVEVTL